MKKLFFFQLFLVLTAGMLYSANTDKGAEFDCYSTHRPVLVKILAITDGPVLELGCGWGSTPLLHKLCKEQNRMLITVEDNMDWMARFKEQFESDSHIFLNVSGKNMKDPDNADHWIHFIKTNFLFIHF